MGIHVIKMPDLGEGIAEVEVVEWRVKPGDQVADEQILADVMTDKATVEIPSPVAGTVLALGGAVGQSLAVGAELIRIEVEGAGNATVQKQARAPAVAAFTVDTLPQRSAPAAAPPPPAAQAPAQRQPEPAAAAQPQARQPAAPQQAPAAPRQAPAAPQHAPAAAGHAAPALREPGEPPLAAPAVRHRAWELGIELQYVAGSGPAGRILHSDLDAYLERRKGGAATPGGADTRYAELHGEQAIPMIGLRRKIAQKMQDAKRRIPHFTYVEEVDVTELEALRTQLNARWGAQRGKLTLLPLLMRAVVLSIRDFPQVNSRFDDEAGIVTQYNPVHLGIATQTDAGLMVPVVRNAEARNPWSSAAEIARLADAARNGKALREELTGSTITITSLGPLGGIVTTPVINHPEVAIVGVNRIIEKPVVRDGAVVVRKMMNLSSSFDHRVIDGMVAAQFVQAIRAYLESPAILFVE